MLRFVGLLILSDTRSKNRNSERPVFVPPEQFVKFDTTPEREGTPGTFPAIASAPRRRTPELFDPMNAPSLGKLVAVHGVSPAYAQRAAVVAALSFVFFAAMMAAFFGRGQFGYFLLAAGFLVVFLFTVAGWLMLRRNVVKVFDRGIAFGRKTRLQWNDIASVEHRPNSALVISTKTGTAVSIPRSIHALDPLERHIRDRIV